MRSGEVLLNELRKQPRAWTERPEPGSGAKETHMFYAVYISAYKIIKIGKSLDWRSRLDSYIRTYQGDVSIVYLRKFHKRKGKEKNVNGNVEPADWYVSEFEKAVIAEIKARKLNKTDVISSSEYVAAANHRKLIDAIEAAAKVITARPEPTLRPPTKRVRNVAPPNENALEAEAAAGLEALAGAKPKRHSQAKEPPQYHREYVYLRPDTMAFRQSRGLRLATRAGLRQRGGWIRN